MTRLLTLALLMGTAALAFADDKKPADKKLDPAKLAGDWVLTSGMKAGKKSDDNALKGAVTIAKDKITLENQGFKFIFSYKLDAAKDPVAIDMETIEPETLKGSKAPGIIKLDADKDTITICYNPMNGTRPTQFESTEGNGNFLFTMKRRDDKKGEKKDK